MKYTTKINELITSIKNKNQSKKEIIIEGEFGLFKKIATSLDIPEAVSLEVSSYNHKNKKDILLKYNKFHKKFMSKFCKTLPYYEKIEDLEKDGYDINSHLMQIESIKTKLEEKNHILVNNKNGKRALGIFIPDVSIDVDFDEIFIIGNSIYNYFYGKGKDLNLFSNNHQLTLNDILQMMESNGINDVGIDPINDFQFQITAEIAKQNVLLTQRPIVKDIILDIYNQSMIEMKKDHTTEMPTMTGLLKKDLIDKTGVHTLRTFRFNFIKIKNGLTLSIRRFMNYDEIDKLGLEGLNYLKEARALINEAIKEHRGANLILGETNSGKSTLLSAILNQIYKSKSKIISIENPIEILMPYLQIDLTDTETADEQFKMTKEIAQKAILRHNPNVVLMGEIRTKDEIEFYAGLGLRGHMAFATLHAGSVENAIEILLKIIDQSELRNILNLFVHQELIACKCKVCNGTGQINDKSCKVCDGVGSSGVIPIYEIVKFNHLNISDNVRDLNNLVKSENKVKYISKQQVIEELYEKGMVHEEDYLRVMNAKKLGV